MSAFSSIIGHASAVKRLGLMLKNDRLPHAILISGPRRVGKRALADALARELLEADLLDHHPDFHLIERGRDEKTGKLRKGIGVDEIRDLRDRLRMTAFLGGRKVAVIDEAERMSDDASNALLKTLEEPSGTACLILVSHAPEELLPTVRSRVSHLPLRRVPEAEIGAALRAQGAGEREARRYATLSGGRPGLALGFLGGADVLHWFENEERRWKALCAAPLNERFVLAADLTPPKADREETVERLRDAIGAWEGFLRTDLRQGSAASASILQGLFSLRSTLEVNVQPRLLVERFLLTFDTL